MTDFEEPAAKISKLEIPPNDQEEDMDEGQEEWLSEGILTDDDYTAGEQDKSDFNINTSSHGDTTPSLPDDDPETKSLPDDPQTMENSETYTQPQDNTNAQDNSSSQDNSATQDNLTAQDNLDAQDVQDNSHSQDNISTDASGESKEYSHLDDIVQAQLDSNIEDNLKSLDDSIAQDKIDAQDNLNSKVDSDTQVTAQTEDNSDAQDNSHAQVNSDAQDNSHSQINSDAQDNSHSQINSDAQDNSHSQVNPNAQDNSHTQIPSVKEQVEPMHTEQTLNEDIEQTLDNFENSHTSEIPDELGAFLIRKPENKTADDKKDGSDMDASTKHSDDDGNDTDELLRMLSEGGQKNKKEVKTKKIEKVEQKKSQESQSSDEDEYIFEGAKVARLKMAKNVIMKKMPTKAVPETVSDRERESDGSSDEGVVTMKKMFVSRKAANFAAKTAAKKPKPDSIASVTRKEVIVHRRPMPAKRPVTSTPLPKLLSKPEITIKKVIRPAILRKYPPKKVPEPHKPKEVSKEIKIKESAKPRIEPDEIIDEEGFLEKDDEFDLDEDFHSEPEKESSQRIMRPEQMDEEVPTDCDSHSEDNESLYDEFPSSGSDQDDWFTLDVRSERAGDYIPLLGSSARQMLTAEKKRVSSRLVSLRQNISAMNESSQQQAEMLRRATLQLAELDAALKA